ncbi:site-specific DNA-methyltransferase (adenine-specific) [Novosphingobium sediminis]|uniref:Site-specific DNA-methyltransferase (adenine-specific) n=1 Tax=Novosphingobium sediminis TaxID=707214 RepID=A0A512AH59_9SPHN|nr:Dam family site-specific DNA-(adenine-N6)-methyltransferase [Novosphingobium sediminis]GEN99038.1 site-specific DNA-methyltransferase (adenine-specific) [Novosphingobium sediminis]
MKPFLKWAGGKRWLFTAEFIDSLPKFERLIEPFLGGGAAFFAIEPKKAVLSDVNPELINLYRWIRDEPEKFCAELKSYQHKHSKDFYYQIRAKKFTPNLDGAVRTLYLNRTCWNGLYRLNKSGKFNVPIGTKLIVYSENDDFIEASRLLSLVELRVSDFENTLKEAQSGDLVFLDPPYTVKHNNNGFVKYNESIFSWEDQERLAKCIQVATNNGAHVILTNADHPSVRALYDGFGAITSVARNSVISGKSSGRTKTTEILLRA